MWKDGVELPALHATSPFNGVAFKMPVFDALNIGWAHYQNPEAGFEVWVDEVAVDAQRIGCNNERPRISLINGRMNQPHARALAALAVLLAASSLAADAMPKRKPGLWEVTMKNEAMPQMPAVTSEQCVDAASDDALIKKGMGAGHAGKGECTSKPFKKTTGGYEAETDCKSAEGTVHSQAKLTGDFDRQYTITNSMTFDPPRHGLTTGVMTVDSKYVGPCPADLKPGEIRTRGGQIFNPGRPGLSEGDVEKLKNMSDAERRKWAEEMMKARGVQPQGAK